MQLFKKVAIVTGASRGIGAAVAARLARTGAHVALVARGRDALEECAARLEPAGGEVAVFPCDLADLDALGNLVADVEGAFGRLDILVNNAGTAVSAPLHRSSDELWDQTMRLNFEAPALLSRHAARSMVAGGWGRIVHVASTAGQKGYAYTAAYTASKHALLGLARAEARRLCGTGVTVNAVCPGYVETPMTERTLANIVEKTGVTRDEAIAQLTADSPLGRLIRPAEVADAVLGFLGPDTEAVTGQALGVAGAAI